MRFLSQSIRNFDFMELGASVLEQVGAWESLSRWERSELGKDLRRLGLSYGEIMELIPVKKSTLATWSRDVPLSAAQIEAIKKRRAQIPGIPVNTQWKRHKEIEILKTKARSSALMLSDNTLWVAGVTLYWGEGSKTERRLSMAHSEPEALRLFKLWTQAFHDGQAEFSAALNLHANNDEPRAREYWTNELDIGPDVFTKTFIKPDGTGHRKNHLQNGICRLTRRRSADAFVTTMEWVGFLRDLF